MLLDQVDTLSVQIERLTVRAEQLLAAMAAAQRPRAPRRPAARHRRLMSGYRRSSRR